jgi:hypothetical protein
MSIANTQRRNHGAIDASRPQQTTLDPIVEVKNVIDDYSESLPIVLRQAMYRLLSNGALD